MDSLEKKITSVLRKYPAIVLGVLYGSAVAGRLGENSDLDVAVSAKGRVLTEEERVDLYLDLCASCEREVDLVDLQRISGPLLSKILQKGKILQKKDTAALGNLIVRVLDETTDMTPNVRYMRQQRRKLALASR